MSGARITVDGLWRCLCPSIDSAALATAISVPYRPRRVGRLRAATTTCAGPRAAPAKRHVHTTPRRLQKDGSAAEKADPFAVLSNAETKATQDTPTSNSTDFDDEEPAVKVDEEYTKAWRGYFDVVFAKANDTVKRQETTLPTSKNIGEQSSSTVVNRGAKKDGIDELFGPTKEKQHKLLNIFNDDFASTFVGEDTGRDLSKWAPDEDAGEYPFDAVTDAGNEKEHNLPRSNNPGQGSPSMIAAMDAEQAPSEVVPFSEEGQQAKRPAPDDFAGSTGFMPKNEETTKTQSVDGVDQTPRARMKGDHEMVDRLVHMRPPFTHVPPEAKRDDILAALTQLRMRGPRSSRRITATLLKHLLSMDLKPQAFHYDLLFRAHCSLDGSADVIANLLQEMRHERVHWSANAYHSVLRALAIHPDYLVRNVIIREMKERWVEIAPKGHRYIALGLLRDEQYELALDKLEQMIQQGIEVDSWVFDIFIYVFGKLEFLDEAMRLVRHRLDRGFDVSVNIWYFLLDVCSKGQNHQATTYIWNRTVQQGIVNPSDGVALNILNMASVYGDTDLATQVIQYLAERGTRLSRPHYEALADAYSMQGNIERAIEVYCIMDGAGAEVNQASAGTLCQSLSRDPSRIDKAVEAMAELKKNYKLPVGVFNAVLNEMVKSSAVPPEKAFNRALDLYRRIREFLPTGPNQDTFRNLLRRCTRPDIAQFLAGEMIAFKIRQNLSIMELMLKVHVEHNGPTHRVKAAFYKVAPHLHKNYAPGSRRWQNIMDLSVRLVKRLIGERDPEAWRILDICKKNGLGENAIVNLREEVEAGRLAAIDAPALSDVPLEDWGLERS